MKSPQSCTARIQLKNQSLVKRSNLLSNATSGCSNKFMSSTRMAIRPWRHWPTINSQPVPRNQKAKKNQLENELKLKMLQNPMCSALSNSSSTLFASSFFSFFLSFLLAVRFLFSSFFFFLTFSFFFIIPCALYNECICI